MSNIVLELPIKVFMKQKTICKSKDVKSSMRSLSTEIPQEEICRLLLLINFMCGTRHASDRTQLYAKDTNLLSNQYLFSIMTVWFWN